MPDWLVLLLTLSVGWWIYRNYYTPEKSPPAQVQPTLLDIGNGASEPGCPHCFARLIPVTRTASMGIAGRLGILMALIGILAVFVNWLTGAVFFTLALLLYLAGKRTETALICPACGKYDKKLG